MRKYFCQLANLEITIIGWNTFSIALQNPSSALKSLWRTRRESDQWRNNSSLTNALVYSTSWGNWTLIAMNLLPPQDGRLSPLFCIINHGTLRNCAEMLAERNCLNISDHFWLLQLNQENSKSQVARLYISETQFCDGFPVQPVISSEMGLKSIALMGRSRIDGSGEGTTETEALWCNIM